jgi:glycosyltransferase involved in cell wall biosynthesis
VKVAINYRRVEGPWGGGNRVVAAIEAALQARGDAVMHDLADRDIDIVLIVDPRARNPQITFTPGDALAYAERVRPRCMVVHRINECDERKGTHTMNLRLRIANYCADHTVFVASWLKDLSVWRRETPATVVLGGGDDRIFARDRAAYWDGQGPFCLVTHHWGAHPNKGLDVYRKLDAMLATPAWRGRVHFTHIGNRAKDADLPNIEWLPPLDGLPLADALAPAHGYLTASIGEPSGNHHIEGALLGMPILYRRSGGLPEYCAPYGIGFDGPDDFADALEKFIAAYPTLKRKMKDYPHTSAKMAVSFLALFDTLVAHSAEVAAARRPWRDPLVRLVNMVPF